MSQDPASVPRLAGRYVVCDEIAAGGTATVHFGRLIGQGFARTVGIKRLHPAYARDPRFVSMFLDEARLAARIRHPNVCSILDVVTVDDVPCLVLEYVHGEPFARLIYAVAKEGQFVPYEVAAGIVCGMLHGLHAAHEATDEHGEPLNIIHRDVSPQNVLLGTDGVPRVVDFGMAKAMGRLQNTAEGQLKGKLGYMAPEQFALNDIDRRVDVYSAAVVLWEALTGEFLFERTTPTALMHAVLQGEIRDPCSVVPNIPAELGAVCMRGLSRERAERYATAHDMAVAIEAAIVLPSPHEIGAWVEQVAGNVLDARAAVLARIESQHFTTPSTPPPSSSASVQGDTGKPVAAKAPRERVAVLVLTVVAILLVAYIAVGDRRPTPPLRAAAPQPTVSEQVLQVESAPSPDAEAAPEASEAAEPALAVSELPSASAPPKARPTLYCNPPYTVDAEGIRHPKRECLVLNPR